MSLGVFGLMLVAIVLAPRLGAGFFLAFGLLGFMLFWLWGCLLLASWFHPLKGTLRQHPSGCAATFLAIWFLGSFIWLTFGFLSFLQHETPPDKA